MASAGNGTLTHVAGELFNMMAGSIYSTCPIVAVPRTNRAHCGAGCKSCSNPMAGTVEHIRSGTLRALGGHHRRHGPRRYRTCRLVRDFLPGYEFECPGSALAPRETHGPPGYLLSKLNREIKRGSRADLKVKTRLADWGGQHLRSRPSTSES